jgi:hypothetical protein
VYLENTTGAAPIALMDAAIDVTLLAAQGPVGRDATDINLRLAQTTEIRIKRTIGNKGTVGGFYNFDDIVILDTACPVYLPHELAHALQWLYAGRDDQEHTDREFFNAPTSVEKLAGEALRERCKIHLDE